MDPQHYHHHQPGMQQVRPGHAAAPYAGYPNGQYQQYAVPNGGAPPAAVYPTVPATPTKPAASSGSSRTAVVLLSIVVAALVVVVIGLGAGLGVSQKSLHDSQDNLNAALASFSMAAPATRTLVVSGTQTSSAATATATAATNDKFSKCPSANNTVYTQGGSGNKSFTVFCDIDYSDGGAVDLSNQKTANMTACMDLCAAKDKCDGVGWGITSGTTGTCYLKANLTKSHNANDINWEFAVLSKTTTNSTTNSKSDS